MSKYNPYSVPDGFFESVRRDALVKRARTRRTIGLATGALLLAGLTISVPYLFNEAEPEPIIAEQSGVNLNEMYNSDIFLLVSNF